jgi:hypothetical protein
MNDAFVFAHGYVPASRKRETAIRDQSPGTIPARWATGHHEFIINGGVSAIAIAPTPSTPILPQSAGHSLR